MESPQNEQEVIIFNSIEVFKQAPEVLKSNRSRTTKAIAAGEKLLSEWQSAWQIEDEDERMKALVQIDLASNLYVGKVGTALSEEKQTRAAITQLMDNFKSMFTEAENLIDVKKDTVPAKVQANRNKYAQQVKAISDRKRQEAIDKENKEKERVEIGSKLSTVLFNFYSHLLRNKKDLLTENFNNVALDKIKEVGEKLIKFKPVFNTETLTSFPHNVVGRYHNSSEIDTMFMSIVEDKVMEFRNNYIAEMSLLRDDLVDQLPSKEKELLEKKRLEDEAEELRVKAENDKKAAAALQKIKLEQEKLEQDKKDREADAKRKLDQEQLDAQEAEATKIEVKAQGESTMAMFEREVAVAETAPTISIKADVEITVLHPVGFTQIFALWFEHEGKNFPVDKIGNTKLDQMKAWCEKKCKKDGTKIESKFLRYDEAISAKTTREKVKIS